MEKKTSLLDHKSFEKKVTEKTLQYNDKIEADQSRVLHRLLASTLYQDKPILLSAVCIQVCEIGLLVRLCPQPCPEPSGTPVVNWTRLPDVAQTSFPCLSTVFHIAD